MTTDPCDGLLPLDTDGAKWVDTHLGRLGLKEKVGQLMVFAHYGTFITPDVEEMITRYQVGGLRVAQKFAPGTGDGRNGHTEQSMVLKPDTVFDRPAQMQRIGCTAAEFATTLNHLRDLAMDRSSQVPLHTAFDQEGEGADFLFEQRLYPFPMGLSASGDPELSYRVARMLGRQTRALGANMIHSPVLDVNTHPQNPEIGPRAYGDTPSTVTRFALESLRGFSDAGIAATGKHFPGRGHSDTDAHFGLPTIHLDKETLMRDHVAPFAALIQAGLPCIMAAFTAYPALGGNDMPAATCPTIVSDLLRTELGFNGVVTTDNVQMGGLLAKFPMGEAVVQCLIAGCDLILCRAYDHRRLEVLAAVEEAVRSGRYPESSLDTSVKRILELRWKMGLARDGGKVNPDEAGRLFMDPDCMELATEAAERSTVVLRNNDRILPLQANQRVLLIEQVHHFHTFINNTYSHPGMLWQEMRRHSDAVKVVAINENPTDQDKEAVRLAVASADLIVSTSYYNYRSHAIMIPFLEELARTGKPIVVVSNTPYTKFGVPESIQTAVVSFCPSGRESLRFVAEVLFGKKTARAKLPVNNL
jgi:beta-N-acetylhexosaminidase